MEAIIGNNSNFSISYLKCQVKAIFICVLRVNRENMTADWPWKLDLCNWRLVTSPVLGMSILPIIPTLALEKYWDSELIAKDWTPLNPLYRLKILVQVGTGIYLYVSLPLTNLEWFIFCFTSPWPPCSEAIKPLRELLRFLTSSWQPSQVTK